ncbi:MAG: metallophosphoesterase, partial [Bacteroidota bacterium]|nr:metallophosphoesterase [Bacteroidota bacterium]
MHNLKLILFIASLLLVDWYVLSGLRGLPKKRRFFHKESFTRSYWIFTISLLTCILLVIYIKVGFGVRMGLLILFFTVYLCKVSFALFILIDDLRRGALFLVRKKKPLPGTQEAKTAPSAIPRSAFLMQAGLLAGAVPLAAIGLNMKGGLYDYHVKRHTLYLPNLPKAFDGLKLGQISDIHSGSFYNPPAVKGGVEMLMREKADVIFFTGDLVNRVTPEMKDYQDIFSKVKAPLGVFSSLGNHDYGDYADWLTPAGKQKNFDDLVVTHKNLGWDLLRNENRRLKMGNDEIGILGVENWGQLHRFPRRGRMDLTIKNTDDLPVKLLLSHDPSHWRAQVLPEYPQIDVAFAGHTHGMQLGIQTEHFQWSPVQYIYNEWAGFYREGAQQLYVNVGYGFIGIHGRVGILPEIT